MIERLLYRDGLPQFYELTPIQDGREQLDELTVLPSEMLDEIGFTRGDAAFNLAKQGFENGALSATDCALRLMRPAEIRRHIRPLIRSEIKRKVREEFFHTPPLKQLSENMEQGARLMIQMHSATSERAM